MARGLAAFSGEALQDLRVTAKRSDGRPPGWSVAELAEAVGATKPQILAYERGERIPEPQRIRRLAAALGVHPLELAHSAIARGSLPDLRRGCGFRASEIVQLLAVSPKVYRRFETEGLTPARRCTLIYEVASVLGVGPTRIDQALGRSPEVVGRVDRMAEVLRGLRVRHVVDPQSWTPPKAGDALVKEFACLVARSPSSVARVLARTLADERRQMLRVDREVLTAMYEIDANRRQTAMWFTERSNVNRSRQIDSLPARLDRFFRYAMSATMWSAINKISDQWITLNKVGLKYEVVRSLPPDLVSRRVDEETNRIEIRLTHYGNVHINTYREWYAALHPNVSRDASAEIRRSNRVIQGLRTPAGEEA